MIQITNILSVKTQGSHCWRKRNDRNEPCGVAFELEVLR